MLLAIIFICVALMIVGVVMTPKPAGWGVLALAILALLAYLTSWGPHIR